MSGKSYLPVLGDRGCPARHRLILPLRCPRGACPSVAGSAGVGGTLQGACPICRLPTPPLACLLAPYPPDPLPRRGRGRFLVFLCKGLRPLHPRGWTGQGASYSCRSDTQGTLRQEDRARTIGLSQYSIFGKSSGGSGGLFQESPSVLSVVSPVPSANAVRRERVRERPSRCMTV